MDRGWLGNPGVHRRSAAARRSRPQYPPIRRCILAGPPLWPLCIWQADNGAHRPLINPGDPLAETRGNLRLLQSGSDPWEYDVILMSADSTTWTYKRDARIRLPLDEILWTRAGVSYLRPEVQLLHKAPGLRPKDQSDFDTCAALLQPKPRAWLRTALGIAHPSHPWLSYL